MSNDSMRGNLGAETFGQAPKLPLILSTFVGFCYLLFGFLQKDGVMAVLNDELRNRFYDMVRQIPVGRVATYSQLGQLTGLHPRQVGYLLHHNPDPSSIPCHRVVNSRGQLAKAFAFGGLEGQRQRLAEEGIEVGIDRVDLARYHYQPTIA